MAIVIVFVSAAMYTLQQINDKMYRHPMTVSNAVISVDGRIYELANLLHDAGFAKTKTKRLKYAEEIHEVTAIMGETSRASSEQSFGVRQVGEEMNDMDNATRQNDALVEESASATKELRGQSERLLQAVDAFKLS